ncbi:nitrogen regulation protein NR(I) [Sphingomonas changnyeongensis]|uniref:DNA-binding transcriptional regulator NtrC n=1 Tax=Sphingomonas changnyeongensis TaxID=2698679 RepID=A0A7Z2NWL9_9SPHN|nr:nitrogen regulation protein NR(I) [Sphingomonas changnyeongensis]QHL91191.1 nitrogen regulation protein NR(I) [Sphingomonas changnyeongensis]
MAHILLLDDDAAIRTVVTAGLRRAGHTVTGVGTISAAAGAIARADLFITDVVLPDGDGLEAVERLAARRPDIPVIVMSAQNTLTTAVRATERGAYEYLPKPFDLDELVRAVDSGLLARGRAEPAPRTAPLDRMPLIGRSAAMQDVYRTIARVVATDLSVLVMGESGTGKELIARAIHELGPRAGAPFVAINMAAIPRELIESELFGHERGAFTGAQARTPGRFEQARGGTLFLDEIGDMPLEAQTRLLRVLQTGEYHLVGGARLERADVRVIAATHKHLPRLIEQGVFREDLYYRLNVVPIDVPPLRRRREDIELLANHFLDQAAGEGLPRKTLGRDALDRLAAHGWPGNVRELENLMRRLAVLAREDRIGAATIERHLGALAQPADDPQQADLAMLIERALAALFAEHHPGLPPDGLYDRIVATIEGPLLTAALAATGGNQLRAASLLGLNRNTLRKKLADHGIDPQRARRRG